MPRRDGAKPWRGVLTPVAAVGLELGLGLGLVLAPARAPASPVASTLTHPKGSFIEVRFETAPRRLPPTNRATRLGHMTTRTLLLEHDGLEFSMTAVDIPTRVRRLGDDVAMYERARDELLEVHGAERRAWTGCRIGGGVRCMQLHYARDGGQSGLARLFLRDRTLVVVDVVEVEATGRRGTARARQFVESARSRR